ncbi:MAG: hypothetical protein ABH919_02845 [bacterium]
MKVFEFHFNPRGRETRFYETFVYEPETPAEEQTGYLYMAGCLNHALPQNAQFLNRLAEVIKEEHYSQSEQSPEKSLRRSLESANVFLTGETKKENVSWLGNLNFAILSLSAEDPAKDWQEFNFSKTGDTAILLVRGNEVIDIGRNSEPREEEIYPLKIFKNVSSGKLVKGDKIVVLSSDVFEYFREKNLIRAAVFSNSEKELKRVLNSFRKELAEISGFCFFITLQRSRNLFAFLPKRLPSLRFLLIPFQFIARSFFYLLNFKLPKFTRRKEVPIREKTIANPFFKIDKKSLAGRLSWVRRNSLLFFLLIIVLTGGFYISNRERQAEIKAFNQLFTATKAKTVQAEELLSANQGKEAETLFREANQELLNLMKLNGPWQEEAGELQQTVEKNLYVLNKLDTNISLDLLFEFGPNETNFIPQGMLASNSTLYFYNPFSPDIYSLKITAEKPTSLRADQNLKFGTVSNGAIFFTNPHVYIPEDNEVIKSELPGAGDFSFDLMAAFKRSLYFLDKDTGEILKYSYRGGNAWDGSQFWLGEKTVRQTYSGFASMAIDGSVWILNDKKIDRYYAGELQDIFQPDIFPALQKPTKIWTSSFHSYVYLLEPVEKRVIILDKQGKLVKQFSNKELNNLKDFAVSDDGKKMYLLNGSKIYQVDLTN